jgi:MATE family multidrug resistance protein
MLLGMTYTGLFAVLYLVVPGSFLLAHTAFANGAEFSQVREATIVLLRFVALYCFFDAAQIMLIGALRGAGDTRFILIATSTISLLAIAVGRVCERVFDWKESGFGLWGWWWVITGWIFTLGVTYLLRFLGGKWKSMRVIEPEPILDCETVREPELSSVK